MFRAHNVTIVRNGRTLLDNVALALPYGKLTIVVGPNGAGKSTLLKVMSGELAPDHGAVTCDEIRLDTISAAHLAERRAVVPQASHLAFPFTACDVVMLGVTVPGFEQPNNNGMETALGALDRVGLAHLAEESYAVMSGGEKQRVHIARAICQLEMARRRGTKAQCLFLDEPTSSLDLKQQQSLAVELKRETRSGRAVMMIAHDLNLAASLADQIALMSSGQLVAWGPPDDVLQHDILSSVYECPIDVRHVEAGRPPLITPRLEFANHKTI